MVAVLETNLGQSAEDYLKAVYHLQSGVEAVTTTALARALEVSPAAATKAIQMLAAKKLIRYRPYHGVTLTARGEKTALRIVRNHRLLELFLHDVLGYRWDEVDAEAERLEHHISDEFVKRIDRYMDYPQLDPHGDPIPDRDGTLAARSEVSLADCVAGTLVVVERVSDKDSQVLQFLAELGLRPGTSVNIVEIQPFNGPFTLRIGGETKAVGREIAGHVFVRDDRMGEEVGATAPLEKPESC